MKINSQLKLGFLGGGQLARMMILEAQNLGIECHVYSGARQDPAAQVCAHWHSGSLTETKSLLEFVEQMDFVTFESEFVPADKLLEIEKKSPDKIFPKPSIMQTIQSRPTQKQLLGKYKIPTADYTLVAETADLDQAWEKLGGAFVLKANYGGYDGYGTHFARKFSSLGELASVVSNSSQGFIAEKMIPFKRELACLFIRSRNGKVITLPLVQSYQNGGICDYVQGPTQHKAFDKIQKNIVKMMHSLDYVGALGVEFFDTGKEILVNELAPRVHNSGHYSQNFLSESQFILHVKAGLGLALNSPRALDKNFVMVNILGSGNQEIQIPSPIEGHVHLYGKRENRRGRKMGHINYLGKDLKKILSKALKERKLFQHED